MSTMSVGVIATVNRVLLFTSVELVFVPLSIHSFSQLANVYWVPVEYKAPYQKLKP